MDNSKITNVLVEGIDTKDYPKFCDAFIASADYNGKPMSENQIDKINEDSEFVYECTIKQLH